MSEFGLALADPNLVAGSTVPIHVSADPDAFREVKVELLLIEKSKGVLSEEPRVVATAPWDGTSPTVDLVLPTDLPAARTGEKASWRYELRLVGDRPGPDQKQDYAVTVTPLPVAEAQARPALGTPGTSRARNYCVNTGASDDSYVWGGLFALATASIAVFAVATGLWYILFPALMFGIFAAVMLTSTYEIRKYGLADLDVSVEPTTLARGGQVRVTVDTTRADLEIGLVCSEYHWGSTSQRGIRYYRTRIVERMAPLTSSVTLLRTERDEPVDYPGERLGLHWSVVVRVAGLKESTARITQKEVGIVVGP